MTTGWITPSSAAQLNLAARLEQEAPVGGILTTYETYAHIKDEVYCEERGQIFASKVSPILFPRL